MFVRINICDLAQKRTHSSGEIHKDGNLVRMRIIHFRGDTGRQLVCRIDYNDSVGLRDKAIISFYCTGVDEADTLAFQETAYLIIPS